MGDLTHYNQYRPYIQDGDVLEWSGTSIISKIIQKRTKSDVSHTSGAAWWNGRLFTLEASGLTFHPTFLRRYMQKCKKALYWLPLRPEYDKFRPAIVAAQLDMVGTPYDFGNLFKSALSRVSNDASQLFCSEAIGLSLEIAGIIPQQESALWPGEFQRLGIFYPRVRIF